MVISRNNNEYKFIHIQPKKIGLDSICMVSICSLQIWVGGYNCSLYQLLKSIWNVNTSIVMHLCVDKTFVYLAPDWYFS